MNIGSSGSLHRLDHSMNSSRIQNRNPSLPMKEAERAVLREGGFVHLVYLTDARNGIIRYSRKAGGTIISQAFHRTWWEALTNMRPSVG